MTPRTRPCMAVTDTLSCLVTLLLARHLPVYRPTTALRTPASADLVRALYPSPVQVVTGALKLGRKYFERIWEMVRLSRALLFPLISFRVLVVVSGM